MKLRYLFFLSFLSLLLHGCEEVIQADLDTAPPRLVVDASIDWIKGTAGNEQHVRLTTTAGYYEEGVPTVSGATVFITNAAGDVFTFTETPGTGDYVCTDFVPELLAEYRLTVISGGQTYTATETLMPTTDVTQIEQDDQGGFFGDEIEVRFFFQDDPAADNYYVVRFDSEVIPFPEYESFSDEFFQGNQSFEFFSHEDLAVGDQVHFRLYGVSRRHQEYMTKLLLIAGGGGQGPFGTAPATVRGNLVNTTDPDTFALGYFRLSEVTTSIYTVQ